MKITAIKELIIDRYERRKDSQLSVLYLEGPAGIGKTEIVKQAAADLGVPCSTVCLAACEAADFSGLPVVDPKTGETRNARPFWLADGPSIVFLDEANRSASDVRQPLMTLIQDRAINGHKVHPDSIFIFAGNPSGGEYEVQDLDPALKERMAKVIAEPDYQALQARLAERYPDCTLEMQWLLTQQNLSPRRVEFTLRAIKGIKKDSPLYVALLTAEIGAEGAGALIAWSKRQKKLCLEQIEYTQKGELTAATKKLIKETWQRGDEAIPVFTSLAKDLVAKFNGSKDAKEQRKLLTTILAVADATEDLGCSSIYLDALSEAADKSVLATHLFDMRFKGAPELEQFRKLLKEDIAAVTYQKD